MARITLRQGDITPEETEAIVNAANSSLWMGGGVAGAIKRVGGREIEEEAVKKGPIPVGEAVVTGAGKLSCKYVIHAAVMGPDLVTDEEKIGAATKNSLLREVREHLAKECSLEEVVFVLYGEEAYQAFEREVEKEEP